MGPTEEEFKPTIKKVEEFKPIETSHLKRIFFFKTKRKNYSSESKG